MNSEVIDEDQEYGVLSIFTLAGDITITWNEQNKEQVLELIRQKMKEGYIFFTTKKVLFERLKRKVKITDKNIEKTEEVIITDEQFERMLKDLDDADVAKLIKRDKATLVKRVGRSEFSTAKKADKAEDVIDKNSVAIRPVIGG
jgi:hypothetical protein